MVKVAIRVNLSANFQSVSIEAGLDYACRKDKIDQGYKRAWELVNTQVADQIDDAKETLRQFKKLRNELET